LQPKFWIVLSWYVRSLLFCFFCWNLCVCISFHVYYHTMYSWSASTLISFLVSSDHKWSKHIAGLFEGSWKRKEISCGREWSGLGNLSVARFSLFSAEESCSRVGLGVASWLLKGFFSLFCFFFSLGWHFLTSGVYFTRCSLARHRCWSLLHYWFSLELRPSNILWQLGICSIGIMHKQLITKSSKLRTCNKSQDHAKCLPNYICIYTIV